MYLDEVHVVEGWETAVRRLLDSPDTRVFLSGSFAALLSREVHTSMRGRSMEVLVHPFSFREMLRHTGQEPVAEWGRLEADERASIDQALRKYLEVGGFPEAQEIEARDRIPLVRGYVDVQGIHLIGPDLVPALPDYVWIRTAVHHRSGWDVYIPLWPARMKSSHILPA